MSAYAEYNHGLISKDELMNWFNMFERPYMDYPDDPEEKMSEEELCWNEGTGEGDCAECDHRWECSGSPYSEEEDD